MSNQPPSNRDTERTVTLGAKAEGEFNDASVNLPTRLDHYMLTELLGRGAMGRVYKADQLEPVRRTVAIKLMSAELLDQDMLARFEAERQALARMSHPNIAQVFDAGASPRGIPYFVMEYAPGQTLTEHCNDHKSTLDERLDLFATICSAILHAHQKGIIHRDIKPSNILVTKQGGHYVPKVIDFGLAKALAGQLGDRSLHTHSGSLLGTPAYMSPEQASLSGEAVDTRTDIYALGLVLYELLTGVLPFRRAKGKSSTIEQVLRAVREDEPPRPSQVVSRMDIAELPPGLGPEIVKPLRLDLDWIVLKCLTKAPDARYQSAQDLLADVRRHMADEPVLARRSSVGYRLSKGARRYRTPLAVSAGVLVLALVLGGGWLNSRQDAAAQARAAQQFGQTVQRMDSLLRIAHTIPAHDITAARERVESTIKQLKGRLDSMEDWAKGPAHYAVGRGLLALNQPRDALEQLKAAWDAHYQDPAVAHSLGLAFGQVYQLELAELSAVQNEEKHARLLKQVQAEYRDPALEYLRLGAQGGGGQSEAYGQALIAFYEEDFERAQSLAAKAIAEHPWLYEAEVLIGQAWTYLAKEARNKGNREAAIAGYKKGEQAYLRATAIGESDPNPYVQMCEMATSHMVLNIFGAGGDTAPVFALGRTACQKAISIYPATEPARTQLAWLLVLHGRVLEKAGHNPIPIYQQAIDLTLHAAQLNPDSVRAYVVAGHAWQRLADYQAGPLDGDPREALKKAAEFYLKAVSLDPARWVAYNSLGNVYSIRGEYIMNSTDDSPMPDLLESIKYFDKALAIQPGSAYMLTNQALTYSIIAGYLMDTGKDPSKWFDKAFGTYQRALEINENHLYGHNNLGIAYQDRGDYAEKMGQDPMPWWKRSTKQFQKAVALNDEYDNGWQNLSDVWAARATYLQVHGGHSVEAARHAIDAGKKANSIYDTSDAWLNMGTGFIILAQHEDDKSGSDSFQKKVRHALKKALELNPDNEDAQAALARWEE